MDLEVREHPVLVGVLVRNDGYVFVPSNKARKGHWTYGWKTNTGYRRVKISGNTRNVHALVLDTFVGPCPEGMVIDHKDRDRSNNSLDNLHYVSLSANSMNRSNVDDAFELFGFHPKEDRNKYQRCRRNLMPEVHEAQKKSQIEWYYRNRQEAINKSADYAKRQRAKGLVHRKGTDGKYRWVPKKEAC